MELLTAQTKAFLSIVETGSITKAAEAMNMSKSSISESLSQLERGLGARLLTRTTRRQSLTAVGENFYRQCRELRDLSRTTLEQISEQLTIPSGPLRITAPYAIINEVVSPAIAKLIEQYPAVIPELIVSDERLDLIKHRIDLALSVGQLPDSEYKAQRVCTLEEILCASPTLLTRFNITTNSIDNPKSIKNLPYIANAWENRNIAHTLKSKKTGRQRQFQFHPVAHANTTQAVISLVQQGIGIALLPNLLLENQLEKNKLIKLLPNFETQQTSVYAVHPFGKMAPISIRALIEFMKQSI